MVARDGAPCSGGLAVPACVMSVSQGIVRRGVAWSLDGVAEHGSMSPGQASMSRLAAGPLRAGIGGAPRRFR